MDISDRLTNQEIEMFAKLLAEGSRDGHFAKEFSNADSNYNYLLKVHEDLIVPNYGQRGFLLVFREKDNPVCFSLVCSSFLSQFNSEILFFSVLKEERRKGYGKKAIELILEEIKGQSVIARCMPKSTYMIQLLGKCGFTKVNFKKSSNINLAHQNG
jgi:RimJ/RimL family protein N-acetyltransferase